MRKPIATINALTTEKGATKESTKDAMSECATRECSACSANGERSESVIAIMRAFLSLAYLTALQYFSRVSWEAYTYQYVVFLDMYYLLYYIVYSRSYNPDII